MESYVPGGVNFEWYQDQPLEADANRYAKARTAAYMKKISPSVATEENNE